jgi:hypothetical protein
MWIDEARRDDQVRRIDGFRTAVGNFSDLRDLPILDCDVGAPPKCARTIDERSVLDDQIVGHNRSSRLQLEATNIPLGMAGKTVVAQGFASRLVFSVAQRTR